MFYFLRKLHSDHTLMKILKDVLDERSELTVDARRG